MISLLLQLILANNMGACAPNWVFVANPYAPECKTFSENFRDACAQCNHNILPAWCNPPAKEEPKVTCYKYPPIKSEAFDTCPERGDSCRQSSVEIQAKNRQIELLRKQARKYKEQIRGKR